MSTSHRIRCDGSLHFSSLCLMICTVFKTAMSCCFLLYFSHLFVQVDLGQAMWVSQVATQGRENYDQWIKSYSLNYSIDGNTYQAYKEPPNVVKVTSLCLSLTTQNCFRRG